MAIRFGNLQIFDHDLSIDFMKYRRVWIGFSVVLTIIAVAAIAIKGINYSIDFLGGAEVSMTFNDKSVTRDRVEAVALKANVGKVDVSSVGLVGIGSDSSYLLRIQREKGTDEVATSGRAEILVKQFQNDLGADKVKIGSVTNISGKLATKSKLVAIWPSCCHLSLF